MQDRQNIITTNLKWSNYVQEDVDIKRVYSFLETLIMMIKAKVLLNNGNLNKTQLTWFYPASMLPARQRELKRMWHDLATKHFSEELKPRQISESIAPFYFYKNKPDVVSLSKPVISIDIGGGTSDVVFFIKGEPLHLSSFRFAANSLFGDGYTNGDIENGFVRMYRKKIKSILDVNGRSVLISVFNSILGSKNLRIRLLFYFHLKRTRQ